MLDKIRVVESNMELDMSATDRIRFSRVNGLWEKQVLPAEWSLPIKVILNPHNRMALKFVDAIENKQPIPERIDITYERMGVVYPAFLQVVQIVGIQLEASIIIGKSVEMDLLKETNCNDLDLPEIPLPVTTPLNPVVELYCCLLSKKTNTDQVIKIKFNDLEFEQIISHVYIPTPTDILDHYDFRISLGTLIPSFKVIAINNALQLLADKINSDERNTYCTVSVIEWNGSLPGTYEYYVEENQIASPGVYDLVCPTAILSFNFNSYNQKHWVNFQDLEVSMFEDESLYLENSRFFWFSTQGMKSPLLTIKTWIDNHVANASSSNLANAFKTIANDYDNNGISFPLINNFEYPNDEERLDWQNIINKQENTTTVFDFLINHKDGPYGDWINSINPMLRLNEVLKILYNIFDFEFKSEILTNSEYKDLILYSNASCGRVINCYQFTSTLAHSGNSVTTTQNYYFREIENKLTDVPGSFINTNEHLPDMTLSEFLFNIFDLFNLVANFDYKKKKVIIESADEIIKNKKIIPFQWASEFTLKSNPDKIDGIAFDIIGDDNQQEPRLDYMRDYVINENKLKPEFIELSAGIAKEGLYNYYRCPIIDMPYTSTNPLYLFLYRGWQKARDGEDYIQASVLDKAANGNTIGDKTLSLHGENGIYHTFYKKYVDIVNNAKLLKVKGVMGVNLLQDLSVGTFFKNNGLLYSWKNIEYVMISDELAEVVMELLLVRD